MNSITQLLLWKKYDLDILWFRDYFTPILLIDIYIYNTLRLLSSHVTGFFLLFLTKEWFIFLSIDDL